MGIREVQQAIEGMSESDREECLSLIVADMPEQVRAQLLKRAGDIVMARTLEANRQAAQAQGGGFRCQSRDGNPLAGKSCPAPDFWRTRPNGDRTCSFCGSVHPDDAISILTDYVEHKKGRFDMTGKGYKFYMSRPDVTNAAEGAIKFYTWHLDGLSEEKREQISRLLFLAARRLSEIIRTNTGE